MGRLVRKVLVFGPFAGVVVFCLGKQKNAASDRHCGDDAQDNVVSGHNLFLQFGSERIRWIIPRMKFTGMRNAHPQPAETLGNSHARIFGDMRVRPALLKRLDDKVSPAAGDDNPNEVSRR